MQFGAAFFSSFLFRADSLKINGLVLPILGSPYMHVGMLV